MVEKIGEAESVSFEKKISLDDARKLGVTLMHGTDWYDYDELISLDEMAKMEAASRADAEKKDSQTTIGPGGVWVSIDNPDSELGKRYEQKVKEYMESQK